MRSCAALRRAARRHERVADAVPGARKAIQSEQWNDAIEPAQRAAELYPEHVGPGSPNLLLARALDKLGRRAEAIAAVEAYRKAGGWDPTALRELARWLDEAGRKHGRDRRAAMR